MLVNDAPAFCVAAEDLGWRNSLGPGNTACHNYPDGFVSLREPDFGDLNLIVTEDKEFFSKFMAATQIARRLNVLDKGDRIALFRAVLFGEKCDAGKSK